MKLGASLAIFLQTGCCCLLSIRTQAKEIISLGNNVKQIVAGELTKPNEFPFMSALGWANNETGGLDFLGGGMLIAPNFVLTAAHCVFFNGKLPTVVSIGGGSLNSSSNEKHRVRDFYIYPEYNDKQAYYDIALLKLEENSGRPPVCLWTKPTLYTKNITAIGYGLIEFAGVRSTFLQKVNLTVFPEEVCQPFFKRQRRFRMGIVESHLCAGDRGGRKDTCQGDSGGPVMVEFKQQAYAAGITSEGQACSGFPPAVYTRISSYIGWIEKIVQDHGYSIRKSCALQSP